MLSKEFVQDQYSYELLHTIDSVITWEKSDMISSPSRWERGQVNMPDLADVLELQLAAGMETDFFSALRGNHRSYAMDIYRTINRNEVLIQFNKNRVSSAPFELHFPFHERWMPFQPYHFPKDGETFTCHDFTGGVMMSMERDFDKGILEHLNKGDYWIVNGLFVPDPIGAATQRHGMALKYIWDRTSHVLRLHEVTPHHLDEDSFEEAVRISSSASESIIELTGVGVFEIPVDLYESQFVANMAFPFKQQYIDIANKSIRPESYNFGYDVFGIRCLQVG
jgi:hypothetical protein